MNLFAEPFVFTFVQDEVAKFPFVDGNEFRKITGRRLIALELFEERSENVIVLCALKILATVVESVIRPAVEAERAAIVGSREALSALADGLRLYALDVCGLAVACVAAKDDQLRLGIEDGGREFRVELCLNVGRRVVAACAPSTALALTIEPEKLVDMGIMVVHAKAPP